MAGVGTPWQLDCENVEQRCGYLLTSGVWSDCSFMLGSETNNQEVIQAHKLVLAMASPVFEAMFYGGLSERNDPIVPIPDVTPGVFRVLLQYVYTGNINIDSIDMACDLWYGADKYMLPHLSNKCKTYINEVVGPSNACRIYELARLFDEQPVMDKCIKIISTHTKEVLKASSFADVELNTLDTVCSLSHLNVDSELDLFHGVARYAEAEQRRKKQISPPKVLLPSVERCSQTSQAAEQDSKPPAEVTPSAPTADKDDLKDVEPGIHTVLQRIRFLSLSAEQFAEGPARSGLLTKDEKFALLMNISSKDSPVPMPTGFSECRERRQPLGDLWEQRYEPGSLDHTIIALQCGSPSQVQDATWAAWGILRTPSDIQPALDKGILEALVPALAEGGDACKVQAALVVTYLCAHGSAPQLRMLAASAALQPYCWLLTAGGCLCGDVLRALTHLLQKVDHNTKPALLPKLREIGVPQLLVHLQQDKDSGICKLANDLLQTYFNNNQ